LAIPQLAARGRGYFIPHRLAAQVVPPAGYPALEKHFVAAAAEFGAQINAAARYLPQFAGFGGPPPAPRFEQDWFPRLDAALAYTLVRDRSPNRIVEVGSGHSTRVMARAIADARVATRLTCIDPAPRASLAGLQVEWIRQPLQGVSDDAIGGLSAGDILFVDSSHVLMPGSDVDRVLGGLMPQLAAGTLVHFHDVFLPDGYPESWTWRGYNEQNALAPLIGAAGWRLLWSSRWAATRMVDDVMSSGLARLPLLPGAYESSLWLEKL
jgi:predicted O-methyltransferase YrrM